jgi:U32 family peptidase
VEPLVPKLEILAPAGDDASLAAALNAGAEAVYFGLDEGLNARARATNFSLATLATTMEQIHRAGAKGYLTLNTLVFEDELPIVERLIRGAATSGVDALIVQDPAVALLARAVAPTLHVHASTQMTISSAEGALFAQALGITRVVVPRELSVDEVKRFAAGTSLELEVFIHGALCVSWSGQCLTSEAWGGRSANRGQCAQSCRLPYELVIDGQTKPLGDVEYLLSPLDLAGARAVAALADTGVVSLKIEGRLKGPAYVMSTVQGYRRWRDAVLAKRDTSPEAQSQLQSDLGRMAVAYSRGFSDGFLAGSDHQDLVEGRFPKHRGALLGEVVEVKPPLVRVRAAPRTASGGAALNDGGRALGQTAVSLPVIGGASPHDARGVPLQLPDLQPGAGVGFDTAAPQTEEPGGPLFGVEPTADGWWLRFGKPGPDLSAVRAGHHVFLNSDPTLSAEAKVATQTEVTGRLGTTITVWGVAGKPLGCRFSHGSTAVQGSTVEPLTLAHGAGLDVVRLAEKLGALGGTPFVLRHVELDGLQPGLHVSPSALKSLRRQLVPQLEQAVLAKAIHAVAPVDVTPKVVADAQALAPRRATAMGEQPLIVPLVRTAEQLEAVIALGFLEVELDFMELVGLEKALRHAKAAGLRVTLATTRIQKPTEQGYDARLARLQPDGVLVRHWGAMVSFAKQSDGPLVHGDFSLNVTNSVTARHLLSWGLDTLTVSHDLDETQLFAMIQGVPVERLTVVAHHHISTFHTEHCVYAHTLSHGRDWRTCGRPCEKHRVALRDVKGHEHPVVVDVGCRNTVFNAQAQSAARVIPRLLLAGVRRYRVELVWEDGVTARRVLSAYHRLVNAQATVDAVLAEVSAIEQFGVTAGTMRTLAMPEGARRAR